MSLILRCDAPLCPSKAVFWGQLPSGWTQTHNAKGEVVHACATTGHLAAAKLTSAFTALATIV